MATQLPLIASPMADPLAWLGALSNKKRTFVDSSSTLIHDIRQRQDRRLQNGYTDPVKSPRVVSQLPNQIEIAPITLLHAIGLITTPIIPKLADLSATWALYRYVWAFDAHKSDLCLSSFAKDIDFHQKAVLSDEVGVGMAYWLFKEIFNAQAVVDVDVILRNPQVANQMGIPPVMRNLGTVPDYMFLLPNDEYAIVECKGSQSGKNTSMAQIRRGLEQVPSIAFANGQMAQEFVVATLLSTYDTVVYVVDPPADRERWDDEADGSERDSVRRKFTIRDKAAFDQSVRRLHAANLLAFAGAGIQTIEIAGIEPLEGMPLREQPLEKVSVDEIDASFLGYSFTIPFRGPVDVDLGIFQGLSQEVYASISRGQFLERDAEFRTEPRYWSRLARYTDRRGTSFATLVEKEKIYSFGRDGSFLQLSLG